MLATPLLCVVSAPWPPQGATEAWQSHQVLPVLATPLLCAVSAPWQGATEEVSGDQIKR